MPEDDSFLDQLKAGAPAAYAMLVEQFEGPLYRFFFCDHRDHHRAQEQTAETFARLVQSLRGMTGRCEQLRAYIFATARHVQCRGIRDRRRAPGPLTEDLELFDPRPAPDAVAADREELARVLAAIGQLEDTQRNTLLLRFVEGCSIEEVAEALDMPIGTIKSHIHRGRARLRQIFSEQESDR